jgi:NAD(P)-dependent dehydrogenase (short-subunit alcohol dehydrogenase family)
MSSSESAPKSVVVTGASTGIGLACAKVLTRRGFQVFGSVRKPADAERLTHELGARFSPLIFDVLDEPAVRAAAATVRAALGGRRLMGLVNNAGVAVAGPLLLLPIQDFRRQFEVNVLGVIATTQAFAPLLGAEPGLEGPPGRIVNISSVGGTSATPFLSPYNASKFALEGLSESLRRELMLFGIDVIVVGPGAVATPIWSKADETDVSAWAGTPYAPALGRIRGYMASRGPRGLKPEKIGQVVAKALTLAHPKVRYTVTPDPWGNWLLNHLPKRMVDRMLAKRLGLVRS